MRKILPVSACIVILLGILAAALVVDRMGTGGPAEASSGSPTNGYADDDYYYLAHYEEDEIHLYNRQTGEELPPPISPISLPYPRYMDSHGNLFVSTYGTEATDTGITIYDKANDFDELKTINQGGHDVITRQPMVDDDYIMVPVSFGADNSKIRVYSSTPPFDHITTIDVPRGDVNDGADDERYVAVATAWYGEHQYVFEKGTWSQAADIPGPANGGGIAFYDEKYLFIGYHSKHGNPALYRKYDYDDLSAPHLKEVVTPQLEVIEDIVACPPYILISGSWETGVYDFQLQVRDAEPDDILATYEPTVDGWMDWLDWCGVPAADSDGDTIPDADDNCSGTADGEAVDPNGCSWAQVDEDLDTYCNPGASSPMWCIGSDDCPDTPAGALVDVNGCSQAQVDQDLDNVCDPGASSTWWCEGSDNCPSTFNWDQRDSDGDDLIDDDGDTRINEDREDGFDNDADTVIDEDPGGGDACDLDDDNDAVLDDGDDSGIEGDNPCFHDKTHDCDDNCPVTHNPGQVDSDLDGLGDICEVNGWDTARMRVTDPSTGASHAISELVNWDPFPADIDGDGDNDLEDDYFDDYLTSTVVITDPYDNDTDSDDIVDGQDPFPTTFVSKYEIALKGLRWKYPIVVDCDLQTIVERWYSYYSTAEYNSGWVDDPGPTDYDGDGISLGAEQCIGTVSPTISDPQHGTGYLSRYDFDFDGASDYWEIMVLETSPLVPAPPELKTLIFGKGSFPFGAGSIGFTVWFDSADLYGETEDGDADWVTIWIGPHVSLGLDPFPIDVGFYPLEVSNIDQDPEVPPAVSIQVLFLDTSGGIHYNFVQVGMVAQGSLVHFDLNADKLDEMALEAGIVGVLENIPLLRGFMLKHAFYEWVHSIVNQCDAGACPPYVRDPAISGEGVLAAIAESPVDLALEDPDGFLISKESSQIPDASYMEYDINGDGDPDDVISIPERKMGNYRVVVMPELDAEPADTYTLRFLTPHTTLVLAENVPISEIPDQPYIIVSREDGIFFDTTPPEAHLGFDESTGALVLSGEDNLTDVTVTPDAVVPGVHSYVLSDEAGNTLTVELKAWQFGPLQTGRILSLQYGDEDAITPPRNGISRLGPLESAHVRGEFAVTALYLRWVNQTLVWKWVAGEGFSIERVDGRPSLALVTDEGSLSFVLE